jgi:uncharacterized protein (TIGR02284 family)
MNSTINETIDTLNHLTEILKDGEYGYRAAAKDVKAPELGVIFERYASRRAEFASTLQARVSDLGAKVEQSGTITGDLRRGWMDLKAALSSNESHAVLVEVERAEDAAVAAFETAVMGREIDQPTRVLLNSQYTEIKSAHAHVRTLRDSSKYAKKA